MKMGRDKNNTQCRYSLIFVFSYCKLVETFHVASECKTAVYIGWWLTLQFSGGQVIVTIN